MNSIGFMPVCIRPLPDAWIGLKVDKDWNWTVRVCAYCPSKKEADQEAARLNLPVTHTICPSCYNKQMIEWIGGS